MSCTIEVTCLAVRLLSLPFIVPNILMQCIGWNAAWTAASATQTDVTVVTCLQNVNNIVPRLSLTCSLSTFLACCMLIQLRQNHVIQFRPNQDYTDSAAWRNR